MFSRRRLPAGGAGVAVVRRTGGAGHQATLRVEMAPLSGLLSDDDATHDQGGGAQQARGDWFTQDDPREAHPDERLEELEQADAGDAAAAQGPVPSHIAYDQH